jgi:hypothetical protein
MHTIPYLKERELIYRMLPQSMSTERHNPTAGFVAEQLGLGIKCCEVALSSGSTATWERKIRDAHIARDMALRFVHQFRLSRRDDRHINQRISHLQNLLNELK